MSNMDISYNFGSNDEKNTPMSFVNDDDDTKQMLSGGLKLTNDIDSLTISFVDEKNDAQFQFTIDGNDNVEKWMVQSDKISQDIATELALDQNITELNLSYSCNVLRNETWNDECVTYKQIWDVLERYVNHHKNEIGEIFTKEIITKCLTQHCDDKEDGKIFEELIGFNRYLAYSVIGITDYLLMQPCHKMALAFANCKYFKAESNSTIANNADPVNRVWSNFECWREEGAVLPPQISQEEVDQMIAEYENNQEKLENMIEA